MILAGDNTVRSRHVSRARVPFPLAGARRATRLASMVTLGQFRALAGATVCRILARAGAVVAALLAVPTAATAQGAVEAFNGNWIGIAIAVETGTLPPIEANRFAIAIDGDNESFDAEWTILAIDDGVAEWDEVSTEFEPAERQGYFEVDDDIEIFDGDPLLWGFIGPDWLELGRLQIGEDSGRRLLFTCFLTRTDAGLEVALVYSGDDAELTRAVITMERK